jgi:hypothetical protein
MENEERRTAPPTPGSAEGERDAAHQSDPAGYEHTPGSAEGERDPEKEEKQ